MLKRQRRVAFFCCPPTAAHSPAATVQDRRRQRQVGRDLLGGLLMVGWRGSVCSRECVKKRRRGVKSVDLAAAAGANALAVRATRRRKRRTAPSPASNRPARRSAYPAAISARFSNVPATAGGSCSSSAIPKGTQIAAASDLATSRVTACWGYAACEKRVELNERNDTYKVAAAHGAVWSVMAASALCHSCTSAATTPRMQRRSVQNKSGVATCLILIRPPTTSSLPLEQLSTDMANT